MTAPSVYDSPDWLALVATICEHPDDDRPRLIAADWLQDYGEEDRAEFIRISVEFDRLYPEECVVADPDHIALLNRIQLLEIEWADKWWPPAECGPATRIESLFRHGDDPQILIRRGFPVAWRGSLSHWLGGMCETCQYWADDGTPRATDGPFACPGCHGTGRTPAHGPRVVARHPITRVEIAEREPFETIAGRERVREWVWAWPATDDPLATRSRYELPHVVLRHIKGINGAMAYPTREAALAGLSDAYLALAWVALAPNPYPAADFTPVLP